MPNWCYNKLVISGPKEIRKKFLSDAFLACQNCPPVDGCVTDFTFHMVMPMPEELYNTTAPRPRTQDDVRQHAKHFGMSEQDFNFAMQHAITAEQAAELDALKARFGADNWYDWCLKNWGVKWDAANVNKSVYARGITITFETAWGPPVGIIHALAAKYPELTFRNTYSVEGYPGTDVVVGSAAEYERWKEEMNRIQNAITSICS